MKHIPKIIHITGISEKKGRGASAGKGKVPYIDQIEESSPINILKRRTREPQEGRITFLEFL